MKDTTMSIAEAEISDVAPVVCDGLDSYFILKQIGFRNSGQLISEGDNELAESLCKLPGSTTRKQSRHFVGSSAWSKQFYDRYLLWLVHTPSTALASNALTKRVAEDEQQWTSDDMRGYRHRRTEVASLPHVPIMRPDHWTCGQLFHALRYWIIDDIFFFNVSINFILLLLFPLKLK